VVNLGALQRVPHSRKSDLTVTVRKPRHYSE
jgi:hypothetical protein